MRYSCLILSLLATFTSPGRATPPRELFNGRDFSGWEFITTPDADITTVCKVRPDGVIAAAGTPIGYLTTTAAYQNYQLHVEYRWTDKPGNSGILVHISSGPKDKAWPGIPGSTIDREIDAGGAGQVEGRQARQSPQDLCHHGGGDDAVALGRRCEVFR